MHVYILTGILEDLRKSTRASREPRVEACTKTPLSESLNVLSKEDIIEAASS